MVQLWKSVFEQLLDLKSKKKIIPIYNRMRELSVMICLRAVLILEEFIDWTSCMVTHY